MLTITEAVREAIPAKVAFMSPSGNGKTLSSLLLAYGMEEDWSKIYVVDTEHERSKLYVGQTHGGVTIGSFKHISLEPPYSPERFEEALQLVEQHSGGKATIIFDSFSHEWDGVGGINSMVKGEGAHEWKIPKMKHKRLVDRIMHSPLNVICTILSKDRIEIIPGAGPNGKALVQTVPDQPIQERTFRREFMIVWNVDDEHRSTVTKDNTGLFKEMDEEITPEHGKMLRDWLKEGKPVKSIAERKAEEEEKRIGFISVIKQTGQEHTWVKDLIKNYCAEKRLKASEFNRFPLYHLEAIHDLIVAAESQEELVS